MSRTRTADPLRFTAGMFAGPVRRVEVVSIDTSRGHHTRTYGTGIYRIIRTVANVTETHLFETREARSAARRSGDSVATWDAIDRVWAAI